MRRLHVHFTTMALLMVLIVVGTTMRADVLVLTLSNVSASASPGSTVTFTGTISNNTGSTLSSTDLFFNFFNFDPVVSPTQLLGSILFTIDSGATSGIVDLFSVTLDPSALLNSNFGLDLTLQDVSDDVTTPQMVTLITQGEGGGGGGGGGGGTATVPEPGCLSLTTAGTLLVMASRRKCRALIYWALLIVGLASIAWAQSPLPVLSTKTPSSGNLDSSFVVFLPVFNTGAADASSVQVTSVKLGQVSAQNLSLPLAIGTISAGDHTTVELQFDKSTLITGNNYLLTVRGTYQSGTQTYGLALNRFITVSDPSDALATQIRHWLALDAVKAKFESLSGLAPADANAALLDFLRGRPEFVASGIDVSSSTVWATFENGEQVGIVNNLFPVAEQTQVAVVPVPQQAPQFTPALLNRSSVRPAAAALPPGPNLPASSSGHYVNTLGAGFSAPTASSAVKGLLSAQHYSLTFSDASVETLKSGFSANDGIFIFATHGGYVGDGTLGNPLRYGLWTSTHADISADNALPLSDVFGTTEAPSTLVRFLALAYRDPLTGKETNDWRYAITASFVRKYFANFSDASLVWIDACSSGDPFHTGRDSAEDMKQAFFEKNAAEYASWPLPPDGNKPANSILLIFDRLLGANAVFAEADFKQRPFDITSAPQDLEKHLPRGGTVISFESNPAAPASFSILAPSIANMFLDETAGSAGQLTIHGIFGSDQGTVNLGGFDANIVSWKPDLIIVDVPANFVSGDVKVTVRSHLSNTARITSWKSDGFHYIATEGGQLKVDTKFNITFRADIRQYRPVIHDPPVDPSGIIFARSDSSATFTCSGKAQANGLKYDLSGQGTYPAFTVQSGHANNTFQFDGTYRNTHTTMVFAVGTVGVSGCTCTVCTEIQCTSNPHFIYGPSNPPASGIPFYYTFHLDDQSAVIAAGPPDTRSISPMCQSEVSANGVFSWDTVKPDNEPDPGSPR